MDKHEALIALEEAHKHREHARRLEAEAHRLLKEGEHDEREGRGAIDRDERIAHEREETEHKEHEVKASGRGRANKVATAHHFAARLHEKLAAHHRGTEKGERHKEHAIAHKLTAVGMGRHPSFDHPAAKAAEHKGRVLADRHAGSGRAFSPEKARSGLRAVKRLARV